MIPSAVHGNPVIWVYRLDQPMFPVNDSSGGPIEKTCAMLLSVADEGSEDERFWVTRVGESGRLMGGEMFYSLAEAKAVPSKEFELPNDGWTVFEASA